MYELISGFGMALSLAEQILVAISVVDFIFQSTVLCSLWQTGRPFSPHIPITYSVESSTRQALRLDDGFYLEL
jgi:hypothetical protein